MPKKIFPNERRQWLERYDAGESEAAIAKAVHRDVRTVKKCIAQARQERDIRGARVELLKNALKQHQDRLLNTLKEVETALVMPARNLWGAWTKDVVASPIGFMGSSATYEAGKGWIVVLTAESKPEWGLVQEHLKGDPLWTRINAWEKAFAAHVTARVDLEHKCTDLLVEKTGYRLVDQPANPPFLLSYTSLDLTYKAVINRVLGVKQGTDFEDMVVTDKERGEVKYGTGTTLAEAPGEEERCKANILEAFKELTESTEAANVKQTQKELEEAITRAKRAVEDILLLELVPGECRVCGRLGA